MEEDRTGAAAERLKDGAGIRIRQNSAREIDKPRSRLTVFAQKEFAMNKQQKEGRADIEEGNRKQAAGEKLSGAAEKAKGNIKQAVGDAKEKIQEKRTSSSHQPR